MKKLFVDYKKCLACKSCETACAIEHHPSHNLFGALGDTKTQINVRVLGVEHEAFRFPAATAHLPTASTPVPPGPLPVTTRAAQSC